MASYFITTLNTSSLLPSSSSSIPLRRTNPRSDILPSSQPSCGFSQLRMMMMMNQQKFLQKQEHNNKKKRGLLMVTRGAPTTNTLIFAFVFPLSLLFGTIFASLKIADKLDQDFLEELAINQAIKEGKDEDGESPTLPVEEKPALPRTRNRPKRQA